MRSGSGFDEVRIAVLVQRFVVRVERALVPHRAQVAGAAGPVTEPAEFLRQPGKRGRPLDRAVRLLEERPAEDIAAERHHHRGQIGDRLVQREALRSDRVVEIRSDAVQNGVSSFMGDDVLR